ncbi:Ig-like domain-containing protein [Pyxidicoccus sp. 3LG]
MSGASPGSLAAARSPTTATLLPTGEVLVVGGYNSGVGSALASNELYDPASGSWRTTRPLTQRRYLHTATLLSTGDVLVVGGIDSTYLSSVEVYHPIWDQWSSVGPLSRGRFAHTATLLPSGKVLVTSGADGSGGEVNELYDPDSYAWTEAASPIEGRYYHTATLMPSGQVLVLGGYPSVASAEVYDDNGAPSTLRPIIDSVTPGASLEPGRAFTVRGSRLRGSSGDGLPVLQLMDLASGRMFALPSQDFSGTQVSSRVPEVSLGEYLLFVTVEGVTAGRVLHIVADATAPETRITSAPDSVTSQPSATFVFDSDDATARFECRLDGAPVFTACTSPVTYAGLAEGSHTFTVLARDGAGNVDATPATHSWRVDLTAPETEITAAPPAITNQSTATFEFRSNEAEVRFECRLDDELFSPCSSPVVYPSLDGLPHRFQVRARDAVGHVDDSPATHSWRVDLSPPETQLRSTPGRESNQSTATFEFVSTEAGSRFECRLDEEDFVACVSPYVREGLADGTHVFFVRARDEAGNVDVSPDTHVWRVDATAPETEITATPPALTNQSTATFEFRSNEADLRFECSLGEADFTFCVSPVTYSSLGDGVATFRVRAIDPVGNAESTPASYSWRVDLTAPETVFTTAPVNPTNQRVATFAFRAEEAGVRFECRLDAADFSPCTSPLESVPLGEGLHTFQVRATDAAGNVESTPASHSWRVDLTAPETEITSGPPLDVNQGEAHFTFRSSEEGVSFECRVDSAAYAPCTSTASYSGLGEGAHTFHVRARDAAGNVDDSAASSTWRVDVTAPETRLTQVPAGSSSSPSATFAFESNEAGARFECSLDDGGFGSCTSPVVISLPEGAHTFQVRARDAAGNVDGSAARHVWVVDLTAPETEITATPPGSSNTTTATFSFRSNEEGAGFECRMDGSAFAPCVSPATFGALGEGTHTFQVRARDAAGNLDSSPVSHAWLVDLTAPETGLSSAPSDPSNTSTATFVFGSNDEGASFECSLDGVPFAACASPATYEGLTEGGHVFQVRARDAAGNVDATFARHGWTVDLTPPDTEIRSAPANPSNTATATFTFGSGEVGVRFECSLDSVLFTECVSPQTFEALPEGSHTFHVRARDEAGNRDPSAASHTWVVDTAAPAAPVITSPSNGATLEDSTPVFSGTAQPGSLVTLTVDGVVAGEVTASESGAWSFTPTLALTDGRHTVSATAGDMGGTSASSATVSFTIDTSSEPPPPEGGGGCGCAAGPGDASWPLVGLAVLAGLVSRRRRFVG